MLMKLHEKFLIALEENELDSSEILFFKGIEGVLAEFVEWLTALGYLKEESKPELNVVKSMKKE